MARPTKLQSAKMADPQHPGSGYRAPALDKGLDIIELLSATDGGMVQADIAKALGRSANEYFDMLANAWRGGAHSGGAAAGDALLLLVPVNLAWRLVPALGAGVPLAEAWPGALSASTPWIGWWVLLRFVLPALSAMNPAMEEAAAMCGARTSQIARRITAPLATPAILAVLGSRIDRFSIMKPRTGEHGLIWKHQAERVMRHPVPYAVGVSMLLLLLAVPFLSLRTGLLDDRVVPPSVSSRAARARVAISPIFRAIAWCSMIGLPKVWRICAYSVASRSAPSAMPTRWCSKSARAYLTAWRPTPTST